MTTPATAQRRRGRPPGHRIDPGRMIELGRAALAGDSLPEIARRLGITRQRADQLLVEAGLHDAWKRSRRTAADRQRFDRVISRRRLIAQPLFCEARALGLAVSFARETLLVEGLYVRVFAIRRAWKCPAAAASHPGYYRWRRDCPTALYVVLFPCGGRRFLLPPHAKESHRYLRADDPAVLVRERWPSRRALRAAARAVADLERRDRKEGKAA